MHYYIGYFLTGLAVGVGIAASFSVVVILLMFIEPGHVFFGKIF